MNPRSTQILIVTVQIAVRMSTSGVVITTRLLMISIVWGRWANFVIGIWLEVVMLRGSPLARLNRWYRHCAIAPMLGIGNGAAQVRKVAR